MFVLFQSTDLSNQASPFQLSPHVTRVSVDLFLPRTPSSSASEAQSCSKQHQNAGLAVLAFVPKVRNVDARNSESIGRLSDRPKDDLTTFEEHPSCLKLHNRQTAISFKKFGYPVTARIPIEAHQQSLFAIQNIFILGKLILLGIEREIGFAGIGVHNTYPSLVRHFNGHWTQSMPHRVISLVRATLGSPKSTRIWI